ncbi:MAG TPA: hypothetical protein VGX23_13805 [Actinocrinis sp.]|nr:hypothetical protein [Actinocrinis sp.]
MLARMFVGGAVGMADNYDGHRLMCQLGVAPHAIPASQSLWSYITPQYDAYKWFGEACSAGGSGQPFLSTEYFPLWVAKQLTWLFGLPGALDLRMLGPVFAVGVAGAVGWTVRELAGPTWARVLIASAVGLVAVDSAVAPYFISPFSEPAGLIGMLLLVPALLRLLSREHVRVRDVVVVVAITLWTIGASVQLAGLLFVIVPVLLVRPGIQLRILSSGRGVVRVVGGFFARMPALIACLVMVGAAVGFMQVQSRWVDELDLYHDVFSDVLGHSSDVPADLQALKLPTSLASAAGSSIVGSDSAVYSPQYAYFATHATFGDVVKFYGTHPVTLFGVADRGLDGLAASRPSYLGNYLASSGAAAGEQECRFCVASAAFTLTEPFRWVVIPGMWLAGIFCGIRLARKRKLPARARGVGIVLAAVAAATFVEFWVVMVTEGDSDVAKNLVFVLLGTMLLGPLGGAAVAASDARVEARGGAEIRAKRRVGRRVERVESAEGVELAESVGDASAAKLGERVELAEPALPRQARDEDGASVDSSGGVS